MRFVEPRPYADPDVVARKLAKNERLLAHVVVLPPSWMTLHDLIPLSDESGLTDVGS